MEEINFEKILPVALPSFQSRVHSVHTTLKTPRKKMSANPPASILYNKKYNMRRPIFASILLPLPTHAQDNAEVIAQKSETQFLPECKPHAQKLLTQFLRHLPTHHPEIEVNKTIKKKKKKSESLKNSPERKEARMAWHYIQRAVWHNGGCVSLDSTTRQQVKWLVASVCSPPLRQAAALL
jgi:hypothetical protein